MSEYPASVLGLLKFTKDSDALFLLDEPDTQPRCTSIVQLG